MSHPGTSLFRRTDFFAVLGIAGLIASMAVHLVRHSGSRMEQLVCAGNLATLGKGVTAYASDHTYRFPWEIAQADGGSHSRDYAYEHWMALSNYLPSPRILACPSDTAKESAAVWMSEKGRTNGVSTRKDDVISIAPAMDSTIAIPRTLFGMDRNFRATTEGASACSFGGNTSGSYSSIDGPSRNGQWLSNMHHLRGNMALADGSVLETDQYQFQDVLGAFEQSLDATLHAVKPLDTVAGRGRTGGN